MKSLLHFCSVVVLFVLMSCARDYPRQLIVAEHAIERCPDSARLLLDSFAVTLGNASKRHRMYYRLLRAEQKNQSYESLSDDTAFVAVVSYFDHHGTQLEKLRAHYMMGCVYRDRGEAPQALQCYHDALEQADTTAINYRLLMKVHSQMADIYDRQQMPRNALSESDLAEEYAWRLHDTIAALSLLGQRSSCYGLLAEYDSVLAISERTARLFREYGDERSANTSLGPAVSVYLRKNNYAKAKEYLDKIEGNSMVTGLDTFLYANYYILYYQKGQYMLGVHQYDSAAYYFYRELVCTSDGNNRSLAYGGLYALYKALGVKDSIVKYADLHRELAEIENAGATAAKLQNIQSMYDYSRHQRVAERERDKAKWALVRFYVALATILTLLVLVTLAYSNLRRKANMKLAQVTRQYASDMLAYQQVKAELKNLLQKNGEYSKQQQRLEEELNVLRQSLADVQNDKLGPDNWEIEDVVLGHDVVRMLHVKAAGGKQATDADWRKLRIMLNTYLPGFMTELEACGGKLDVIDTEICLLTKLRFAPGEVCALVNIKPSALTNRRTRMHAKMFGETGSATEFDKRLREM